VIGGHAAGAFGFPRLIQANAAVSSSVHLPGRKGRRFVFPLPQAPEADAPIPEQHSFGIFACQAVCFEMLKRRFE
jgi:hypothetical protein